MQFEIAKSVLENILIHTQPFLEKKDLSQITSHLYFEATASNTLTVKATDYEIGLVIEAGNINVIEPGMATANGKKLLDIVRILSDGNVNLNTKDGMLDITQGHSDFQLPMYNAQEFPAFASIENKPGVEIDSGLLINSLKKITPAADTNNPKFELNGALIDIKSDQINFVATDTRRLAIIAIPQTSGSELSLIIPKKAIIEIQKLFTSNIDIYYDATHLLIKSDQYTFFTKLINGKFPDYNRIIPASTRYNLTLPKSDIVNAIKQITTISNDMKLTLESGRILFESLSDENNKATTEINVDTGIDSSFVFAVNSRYILDFLGQIDQTHFTLGLNEPNMPFMLQEEAFKTIVMPIVI
ncbi:DNA polymerase III subunit beta [Sulfurimonas sp. HSL-3221]|uniref:DNA polymerase III subunit beta n=1 Tax=Sulfurimonadaceae TaxID=2771471 RepID=UPI001E5CCAE2|nr:DNA polymerase III subunit beta [Sulfurimonas sp. HSL-3221]UFS62532.1 DNA polymerase III subunit beta [Sulfurimonas sp. HSL-3221]